MTENNLEENTVVLNDEDFLNKETLTEEVAESAENPTLTEEPLAEEPLTEEPLTEEQDGSAEEIVSQEENTTENKKAGLKSRNVKKFAALVIIIAGLLMVCSPWIGQGYNYFYEKWLISNIQDEPEQEEADNTGLMVDLSLLENEELLDSESGLEARPSSYRPTIIGTITIPKLNLTRPISNDVSRSDLRVAIGKVPGSTGIGQPGNISLAGHRNYAYKVFFNNLDRLEIGDKVILESNKGKFTYEVYERLIVEPDEGWVMAIDKSQYIATLITCHPKYVNDKRLIYKAKLIDPAPPVSGGVS